MNFSKKHDIILSIILPVTVGCSIYLLGMNTSTPVFVKNHLSDGLWAFAFASSILIIWDRKINTLWIILALFIAVLFELLQHFHLLPGTGDLLDIGTYFLFFTIALLTNSYISKSYYYVNN